MDEMLTGEVVTEDADGNDNGLVTYFDGVPHGPQTTWFPNGRQKQEGQCDFGAAVGEWRKWRADGVLAELRTFTANGDPLTRQRWDVDGRLTEDKAW